MSKVEFDFPHLENAQVIFKAIQSNYDKFDWNWPDADRAKNRRALQEVMSKPDVRNQLSNTIRLFEIKGETGESSCTFYYREERLSTFVDLYPDWIEQVFDFWSPLDVLNVLDEAIWRAEEMKTFYQIKAA